MSDRQRVAKAISVGMCWWLAASSIALAANPQMKPRETPKGTVTANSRVVADEPAPPRFTAAPEPKNTPSAIEAAADQASAEAEDTSVVSRRAGSAAVVRQNTRSVTGSGSSWYLDGLLALGAVLGMIGAGAFAFKKWGKRLGAAIGGGGRHLEVVARLALSPKQSVCLIRVGRQLVLAGLTPDRINSLMIIDDPERVSELLTNPKNSRGSGLGATFGRLFSGESSQYADSQEDETPDELPLSSDGRYYRQARTELSGLLEKLRSRESSVGEQANDVPGDAERGTIAIA